MEYSSITSQKKIAKVHDYLAPKMCDNEVVLICTNAYLRYQQWPNGIFPWWKLKSLHGRMFIGVFLHAMIGSCSCPAFPFCQWGRKGGDFPKWAMQKGYKKVYKIGDWWLEIGARRGREVIRRGEWEMLERQKLLHR